MYHPKIAELETGIKSLKTKILGIPIQNFKENIRGLIIDDINSLKKLYAELSVEKKGTLSFKTGGFPIPPAQSPSPAPSPPPEEKIVYNKIFDILVENY